jgi:carbamoyltransferase
VSQYVLGVNSYLHDSSAALLADGRLVFAAEEERLSRVKKDGRFPTLAIQACLDHASVSFGELAAVAFGWNRPGRTPLHTLKASLTGQLPRSGSYLGWSAISIARELRQRNGARRLEREFGGSAEGKLFHVDHHESHAWSAYGLSGWNEALVVVMDGRGATQATTLYHAMGDHLKPMRVFQYPNSLGALYEAFTDLLGFERNNDEWKVMGLAAYGTPNDDLREAIEITDDGYRVNAGLICGRTWGDLDAMVQQYGARRNPERSITDEDRNLAASVQQALERAVFALVKWGVAQTGCRRLCLAGGVAMNSKANGRLLATGLVDDVFVQPAATDDGTAIGAAIAAHARLGMPVPRYRLEDVYLGPEYSNAEVASALTAYRLPATRCDSIEAVTASLLAEGAIVGWFQGRMEFGPRALGNRSILADPRSSDMKDRVNECVKFREGWRPFAPSCLAEVAESYFDGCRESPYMILTFDVLPHARASIPAVTHADNTARVQTIRREANPRYWRLIQQFGERTGVPVVMNTSFNLRGEPIVCSPKDAVRTFYSSGLDYLVMNDYILAKDPAWTPARVGASLAAV